LTLFVAKVNVLVAESTVKYDGRLGDQTKLYGPQEVGCTIDFVLVKSMLCEVDPGTMIDMLVMLKALMDVFTQSLSIVKVKELVAVAAGEGGMTWPTEAVMVTV
jgi:hypothetical protein